jgi:hypothetical protein
METTKNFSPGGGHRVSDASINTTSSGDSGYVSGLADANLPKGKLGDLFHFSNPLRLSRDKQDASKRTSLHSGSSTASVQ